MENWASFTGPSWVSNSSGQRTFVTHCYPDLQKAWTRATNTPLVVINSKMMPFKELGLDATIFLGKKSRTGTSRQSNYYSHTEGFRISRGIFQTSFFVPRLHQKKTALKLESKPQTLKIKHLKLNLFSDASITAKEVSCITCFVNFYSFMTCCKLQYRTHFSDNCIFKWYLQIKCKHEPKQTSCK